MYFTIVSEVEKLLPLYVTGIGSQSEQEAIDRPKGFLHHQWTYCSKGRGKFLVDGHEYILEEGMGFYFVMDYPHAYSALSDVWETKWITFRGNATENLFHQMGLGNYGIFNQQGMSRLIHEPILTFFDQLECLLLSEEEDKIKIASPLLYLLLTDMKSALIQTKPASTLRVTSRLRPVIHYLTEHYDKDLSLEDMAQVIGVTPTHICKLFKKEYGMSPTHYLMHLRLQASKRLLIHEPQLKIYEISQQIGYQDTSYFCSVFKKQEGTSPKGFRALHGVSHDK